MGFDFAEFGELLFLEFPYFEVAVGGAGEEERHAFGGEELFDVGEVVHDPLVFFVGEYLVFPVEAVDCFFVGVFFPVDLVEGFVVEADGAVREPHRQDHFRLDGAEGHAERDVLVPLADEGLHSILVALVDVDLLRDGDGGEQSEDGQAPGYLEDCRALLFIYFFAVDGEKRLAVLFVEVFVVEEDLSVGVADCEHVALVVVLGVEDGRFVLVAVVEERLHYIRHM